MVERETLAHHRWNVAQIYGAGRLLHGVAYFASSIAEAELNPQMATSPLAWPVMKPLP